MDWGWIGGGLGSGFGVDWGWIGVDWSGLGWIDAVCIIVIVAVYGFDKLGKFG